MDRSIAIETRALTKTYGEVTALGAIDLQVQSGSVFGLLGPNGSGKSTLMRLLCAALQPTSGEVRVLGLDPRCAAGEVRRQIGYVSQSFSQYGDLTVEENLRFYAQIYGFSARDQRARVDEVVALLRLGPYCSRRSALLSGGWKQRLALACAILHRPRVVLLDEPTAGIDPVARRELWDLLFMLAAEGATLVVSTHYMDEAERCQQIAFLYLSRLLAAGSPSELKAMPAVFPPGSRHLDVRSEQPARARALLLERRLVRAATIFGLGVHVIADSALDPDRVARELSQALGERVEVEEIAPQLEDVFVELTRRAQLDDGTRARDSRA